jgi:hypothetical protein
MKLEKEKHILKKKSKRKKNTNESELNQTMKLNYKTT